MSIVGACPCGELAGRGTGLGVDNKDVGVVAAVGVCVLVADVGDGSAVGRPLGVVLVDFLAGGQLLGLPGAEVVDVEGVERVVAEIALDVLLEVIAVDDYGLGGNGRLALFRIGLGFGVKRSGQ
jgi:hypothetical protein